MATLLDGKALARRLNEELREKVSRLERRPGLAVVLVGDNPASKVYVRRKGEVADRLGFVHRQIDLPASTTEKELLGVVDVLNEDPAVDGILVQLPLPGRLSATRVMDRIHPTKDVDGFTAVSSGLLSQGRPRCVPCTPLGIMRLLGDAGIAVAGREAVVVGRSNIVGRPMAQLLEQANATVTVCHSRTRDLAEVVLRAEVLVVAIGRAECVRGSFIREGAVVIDVGMNRLEDGRLVGDVEFQGASERASAITPVPGGVGPMTIAMLMQNTYAAALSRGC